MTPKEKAFADYYLQSGNASEAARMAGYSESTATYASNWLNPKKPKKFKSEVYEYIQLKTETSSKNRELTREQKRQILNDIAMDPAAPAKIRIKAIDVDNKMSGEYINKVEVGTITVETSKLDALVKQMESDE